MTVSIGDRLRAQREKNDLSVVSLARATGLSEKTIHRYEHGDANPTYDTLSKLAEKLGCTVSHLIGEAA